MAPPARLPVRLRHIAAHLGGVRSVATTPPSPPSRTVLDKYRHKLEAKARAEGHADVAALKQAYADSMAAQRRSAAVTPPPPVLSSDSDSDQQDPRPAKRSTPPARQPPPARPPAVTPLSALLDLPKARTLPAAELAAVWRLRHAADPRSLCAAVPAATFAAMERCARAVSAQFVLPVPRGDAGAEMHFLQWTWDAARTPSVLFTRLAEYKLRGAFAQPHTTVTHHVDLAADTGLVLMRGQVVEGTGVSVETARWLVMCLQRFYGGWDGEPGGGGGGGERAAARRTLLAWFAQGDERFSVEKLMEETERLG
ncbi:hypothetical protein P8C59_003605 [Phyllachora maydis]|uniref:ATP synthase mitochondrial F1 complex assembly factor 1 n=1 Tax=Phyllachora maydis TaxID=1825666 RepID=A0AAD9I1R6_9PEZI|nr:hypothetical protein P8C59_003605 [Phyllachora maydis]